MIKYLGSKRALIPSILDAVESFTGVRTVLDLFSGTSRVGHALKARGYRVIANDHNAYAHTLATCYVQADDTLAPAAESLIADLNALAASIPPQAPPPDAAAAVSPSSPPGDSAASSSQAPDPFTRTYCLDARFFHPDNGPRIYAVRNAIASLNLDHELEAVLLTSLLEAADRVDSTTGLQMAYLKTWAPRAFNPLELRLPRLLPRAHHGRGVALRLDALEAAREWAPAADLLYLDPPYNQHSYLGNYHIWETLVRWDFPPVYGAARKRHDVRTRRSPFNSRRRCLPALAALLDAIPPGKPIILSFNNEGFITRDQIEPLLARRGTLRIVEHDYPRYVGARIGIHNPRSERVGRVSHLRNKELLFIVTP